MRAVVELGVVTGISPAAIAELDWDTIETMRAVIVERGT